MVRKFAATSNPSAVKSLPVAGFTSIEICAGAGGQAIGLEAAGFEHLALVEYDKNARDTLRLNRPSWNVLEGDECDVRHFSAEGFRGVDLLAGGVPCPPFSVAGKQLGQYDERDLFPHALRLTSECRPKAVMIENVRGLLDSAFADYRGSIQAEFRRLGYWSQWRLLNASHFGVPQLRPRAILVAIQEEFAGPFNWPTPNRRPPVTVGEALCPLMSERGWRGAEEWKDKASGIAPTIVGGSKKHGGPDLGPTRARQAWERLSVNGKTIALEAPEPDFHGLPRLTIPMVAKLQGFDEHWVFSGSKTAAYRQVGNAFPPPVAEAVGRKIWECLASGRISAGPPPRHWAIPFQLSLPAMARD